MKKNILLLFLVIFVIPGSLWAPDIDLGDFTGHDSTEQNGDDGRDTDSDGEGSFDKPSPTAGENQGSLSTQTRFLGGDSTGPTTIEGGSNGVSNTVSTASNTSAQASAVAGSVGRGLDFTLTRKSDGSNISINKDGSVDVEHQRRWSWFSSKDQREMDLLSGAREALRKQWHNTTGDSSENEETRNRIKEHFDAVDKALRESAARVQKRSWFGNNRAQDIISDRMGSEVENNFDASPRIRELFRRNEKIFRDIAQNNGPYKYSDETISEMNKALRNPLYVGRDVAESYQTLDAIAQSGREWVEARDNGTLNSDDMTALENKFFNTIERYKSQVEGALNNTGENIDELTNLKERLGHQLESEAVKRSRDLHDFLEGKIIEINSRIKRMSEQRESF